MERLRDRLTIFSRCRYLAWRATGRLYDITLQLRAGGFIILRRPPAKDAEIAHELFVLEVYQCPYPVEADRVINIVDVGANVGFSCVHWLHRFPRSHVTAFEPHPEHVRQIKRHLQANAATKRVTLVPSAAGVKAGELFLTDQGPESALLSAPSGNSFSVPVVDWFAHVGKAPIDLLKIDIEGGEYSLLSDARFEALEVGTFVLEWHDTTDVPDGRSWCVERLQKLGYEVMPGKIDQAPAGLLWATRENKR